MGDRRTLSRRTLLGSVGGGLAGLALPLETVARQTPGGDVRPVGIQLYTVRDRMAADLPGTLARIAEIGYEEVEFAGYFDTPPTDVRRHLEAVGLRAPAAHIGAFTGPAAMLADPQRFIGEAAEVGHRYFVVPWLDPEDRETLDQYRALADVFNTLGEACRAAGLQFAYHNHDFELATLEGATPYDILLERCDPALVAFELDLYWVRAAGRDPLEILAAHPGRFPLAHVKDMAADGRMADVGAGTTDFATIFSDPRIAPFEHLFVERDDPSDSFATAEASFAGLRLALDDAALRRAD